VIFPANAEAARVEALQDALKELSLHARTGCRAVRALFQGYAGPDGYRAGESKQDWLTRQGAGPGPANPDKVPYYLLLVGDRRKSLPLPVPARRAVCRRADPLRPLEDYARYARSVVEAENPACPSAAFFGVANPDDKATSLSATS
jgi:hypothetical protein